jgi:spore maturation protein CgeB
MRILYVGMKYDYGKPEQGYSFEHHNFFDSLVNMGNDIIYFDFMTLMQQHGRDWMNDRLLEVAKEEKADLMFTVLFKDELDRKVVKKISSSTDTVTLNWFCDDHWRFDNFSRDWAPCFDYVVTTAASALPKYERIGYENVIKSQWACNHFSYKKLDLPLDHDVTFIGQPHGNRRMIIRAIKDAKIDVLTWGNGWESGRVTQEEMIKIFNRSRINLNLSNSSNHILLSKLRALLKLNGNERLSKHNDQIKGRNFEIPGCGGFILTGKADNLEDYYTDGKDIVCFETVNDIIGKINYYIENDDDRKKIADAGYKRTLSEHTYVHRFNDIFARAGLKQIPVGDVTKKEFKSGLVTEIK